MPEEDLIEELNEIDNAWREEFESIAAAADFYGLDHGEIDPEFTELDFE